MQSKKKTKKHFDEGLVAAALKVLWWRRDKREKKERETETHKCSGSKVHFDEGQSSSSPASCLQRATAPHSG